MTKQTQAKIQRLQNTMSEMQSIMVKNPNGCLHMMAWREFCAAERELVKTNAKIEAKKTA